MTVCRHYTYLHAAQYGTGCKCRCSMIHILDNAMQCKDILDEEGWWDSRRLQTPPSGDWSAQTRGCFCFARRVPWLQVTTRDQLWHSPVLWSSNTPPFSFNVSLLTKLGLWNPGNLIIVPKTFYYQQHRWIMITEDYSIFSRHHDPHHLCEAGAGGPGTCYHQGLQCPAQDHLQDSFWGQWTASHSWRCQVPKICWDRQSQTAWRHSQVDHATLFNHKQFNSSSDLQKYQTTYPRAGQVLEVSGNKAVVQVGWRSNTGKTWVLYF